MRCPTLLMLCCLLAANHNAVTAFQSILRPTAMRLQQRERLYDSKEEEIAKLEEQLKKLKEEATTEAPTADTPAGAIGEVADEPVEEVPIELFLSEQWKEKEQAAEEGGGGGFGGIIGVVGIALFLAVFSQVPVGQEDLSKYSAIKAPVETIDLGDINRERRAGDL